MTGVQANAFLLQPCALTSRTRPKLSGGGTKQSRDTPAALNVHDVTGAVNARDVTDSLDAHDVTATAVPQACQTAMLSSSERLQTVGVDTCRMKPQQLSVVDDVVTAATLASCMLTVKNSRGETDTISPQADDSLNTVSGRLQIKENN